MRLTKLSSFPKSSISSFDNCDISIKEKGGLEDNIHACMVHDQFCITHQIIAGVTHLQDQYPLPTVESPIRNSVVAVDARQ